MILICVYIFLYLFASLPLLSLSASLYPNVIDSQYIWLHTFRWRNQGLYRFGTLAVSYWQLQNQNSWTLLSNFEEQGTTL